MTFSKKADAAKDDGDGQVTISTQSKAADLWCCDWQDQPYWLDGLPDDASPDEALPATVDVLVVGSGYTGLNAAIETARGGRSTLVLDAGSLGHGCSTRNGGQISTSIKPSLEKLTAKYGAVRARAIRKEGETALQWIEERIVSEGIACDFRRAGRFHAAHSPKSYEEMAREAAKLTRDEYIEAHVVPHDAQRAELGSDVYHGGVVFPRHASVDPGRYHHGLLRTALGAGVHAVGDCAVTRIERTGGQFDVTTPRGTVRARDVVIATNGYTGALTPWLQRRIVPIGSYVIATERLPRELVDRLFPTDRIASDSCKVVYYFRASPDRTRIVFGGRVSANETNPSISGPRLYQHMCWIFPELRAYRISHSWVGTVAYSFDELAHTGVHEGIHYAMGYCGSGVSMASYLGMRLGQKVLGMPDGQTAFDGLRFPTRPLYRGRPWFLPPIVAWYRWRDGMQNGQGRSADA